jgi:uncharacterized protein (DUF342 family)
MMFDSFVSSDSPAEPRLRITVMPDRLSAMAALEEHVVLVEPAEVHAALEAAGIRYGVLPEAVTALCTGEARQAVIARGHGPQPGRDTRFEPLLESRREAGAPRVNEDGRVDFLDLDFVRSVTAGEALMRRIPPTPGTEGCNLWGEILPARDGRDLAFRRVGLGTRLSPKDADLLVAATAGLPTFGPDFVQVDPVLWVPAVDVSTGHIRFAGSVVVAGDVGTGLQIEAEGDVIVAGTVDAATIVAGGNVELRGGMAGHGTGSVQAGGSVTARYLDSVTVIAGEDLYFEETISHCDVTVAQDVVAISAMGRGQVIGGQLRAGRAVRARGLGAPAGTVTLVGVGGADPERLQATEARCRQTRLALAAGTRHLVQLRMAGADPQDLQAGLARCERLQGELQVAEHHLEVAQPVPQANCYVQAVSVFYGGVEVRIGDQRRLLRDDLPGAKLVSRDGQVVVRYGG